MKMNLKVLCSGIFSGILISIGGLVYLSSKSYSIIAGSLFFAFGLFSIIMLNLYLYTGKIGYIVENKGKYLISCLLGNAIGAIGVGYIVFLLTKLDNRLLVVVDGAISLSQLKLSSSWLSILFLSFMCGIMIFLAVEMSKRDFHPLIKVIAIFLAIAIFILCGFEHCIANMFYLSASNSWSLKAFAYILLMILGNSLGSIFTYYLLKASTLTKNH